MGGRLIRRVLGGRFTEVRFEIDGKGEATV